MKTLRKLIVPFIITVLSFTACGSSSDSYYDSTETDVTTASNSISAVTNKLYTSGVNSTSNNYEESYDSESYTDTDDYSDDSEDEVAVTDEKPVLLQDKIIYTADIEIQTKEFDSTREKLNSLMTQYNGVIDNESYTGGEDYISNYRYDMGNGNMTKRRLDVVLRIPSEHFKEFMNKSGDLGNVIDTTTNAENITTEYYNNQAQLDALQIQLARLQELLKQETDIENIVYLTSEISKLEYQINTMKTTIRTMDIDVAYSTVTMSITEVVKYDEPTELKEDTFVNRLFDTIKESKDNFLNFLENILFAIIILIPYLVVLAVILVIIIIPLRKRTKRLKEKEAKAKLNQKSIEAVTDSLAKSEAAEERLEANAEKTGEDTK